MSARDMWRWLVFSVTGRVPGQGDQPSRKWLKGYRKLRLAPNDPMQTGVLYSGHTGQRDCPCPYCPTELERLEASGHLAPERRVVTADEAAGLGLVDDPTPLDGVYRERAKLVALLAALYPSTLVLGADPEEPDWAVLFITLPTGQASWHIAADDLSLFHHVDLDDADTPGIPEWDGHSTDEKYERIAALIRTVGGRSAAPHRYLSTGCLHGDHGYCQSNTGSNGTKTPASCKFCGAGCECGCHDDADKAPQLRCVCGDPVTWMDCEGGGWIHEPGSDTKCLNARPRCPDCQLPHDLEPGSPLRNLCRSLRAAIAAEGTTPPDTAEEYYAITRPLTRVLGGDRSARVIAHTLGTHGYSLAAVETMSDEELLAVPGIGETSLARIRAHVPGGERHTGSSPYGIPETHRGSRENCTYPDCEPEPDDTVPVPRDALRGLVEVAMWVSRGRSMAFIPDDSEALGKAYPDAKARFALGALDDAGLLDQFREED